MVREVVIKDIDRYNVEKDDNFRNTYSINLILSEAPDSMWRNYFDRVWAREISYPMKRRIIVNGDTLKISFGGSDDVKKHIDEVKHAVTKTNEYVRKYNQEEDNKKRKEEEKKREIEDTLRSIKDKVKDIQI